MPSRHITPASLVETRRHLRANRRLWKKLENDPKANRRYWEGRRGLQKPKPKTVTITAASGSPAERPQRPAPVAPQVVSVAPSARVLTKAELRDLARKTTCKDPTCAHLAADHVSDGCGVKTCPCRLTKGDVLRAA
jgi:hypothetical protein